MNTEIQTLLERLRTVSEEAMKMIVYLTKEIDKRPPASYVAGYNSGLLAAKEVMLAGVVTLEEKQ
jgi:hypothetical protein